jgi:hypothetical protein
MNQTILTDPAAERAAYIGFAIYRLRDFGHLVIDLAVRADSAAQARERIAAFVRDRHGEPDDIHVYELDRWAELCAVASLAQEPNVALETAA